MYDIFIYMLVWIFLGWLVAEYIESKWNIRWQSLEAQIISTVVIVLLWPLMFIAIITDAVEGYFKRKKRIKF